MKQLSMKGLLIESTDGLMWGNQHIKLKALNEQRSGVSSSGKLYRAFQALVTLGQLPVKSKLATAFRVPTTQLSDVRKL